MGERSPPLSATVRGRDSGDADLAASWLVDRFSQAAAAAVTRGVQILKLSVRCCPQFLHQKNREHIVSIMFHLRVHLKILRFLHICNP